MSNVFEDIEWVTNELKTRLQDEADEMGLEPDHQLTETINRIEAYLENMAAQLGQIGIGYDESEPGHPDNPRTF